jgi:hypothetical protein
MGGVGRQLVAVLTPWVDHGRAAAVDSTPLNTSGGVWPKKHQEAGEMPHPSIETAAGWSQAGWHGWWYGGTRPLAVSVGAVWSPLAAALPPAHTADHAVAPRWLAPLPAEVRDVLGETASHDPAVRQLGEPSDRALVATQRGAYPHHDDGVEVRQIFQTRRSQSSEPFNGLCKTVFEGRTQMPVKGLQRSQLLALGAIVVYQWVWLYQHEHHLPLGQEIKPLLRAA